MIQNIVKLNLTDSETTNCVYSLCLSTNRLNMSGKPRQWWGRGFGVEDRRGWETSPTYFNKRKLRRLGKPRRSNRGYKPLPQRIVNLAYQSEGEASEVRNLAYQFGNVRLYYAFGNVGNVKRGRSPKFGTSGGFSSIWQRSSSIALSN